MKAWCVFFLISFGLGAFSASLPDSISDIKDIEQIIRQNEKIKLADSVQKALIVFQINQLSGWDTNQKNRLQAELRQMAVKDSARLAQQKLQIADLRNSLPKYPIAPFHDTLFYVMNKFGSVSAEERADRINTKIRTLYKDLSIDPDSILMVNSETIVDIIYNDLVIMRLYEADALLNDKPLAELGNQYKNLIIQSIKTERAENSLINILTRVGLLLLILIILYLIIWGILRFYKYLMSLFERKKDFWLKQIDIGTYELLSKDQELKWINLILSVLKWTCIILAIYFTLPFAFRLFTTTQGWSGKLFDLALSPVRSIFNAVWDYMPNLVTIIVISLIMKYFIRFVKYIFKEIESGKLVIPGFHADWAMPTYSIAKFLLLAFSFVLIFPYLPGSDSNIFKGVSVFIGVLFSLGSSSAIANMIAGLVITYMRPFKIGDRIKIADMSGDVIEKTLLVTRLRTIKNEEITIPNSAILTGNTINYSTFSKDTGLVIHTTVTIGYDVPWRLMHEALIDAAGRVEFILKDPKPFVLQTSLDDFYVAYQINAYTREANRINRVLSLLHQSIQDSCNEKGIEIMSPHYRAQRDGNNTTIPGNYLENDYQPPPFHVDVSVKNNKQ